MCIRKPLETVAARAPHQQNVGPRDFVTSAAPGPCDLIPVDRQEESRKWPKGWSGRTAPQSHCGCDTTSSDLCPLFTTMSLEGLVQHAPTQTAAINRLLDPGPTSLAWTKFKESVWGKPLGSLQRRSWSREAAGTTSKIVASLLVASPEKPGPRSSPAQHPYPGARPHS